MQIFIDLDRTLVRTDIITETLQLEVARLHGNISVAQISRDYPHFRPVLGEQAYYDFFGQVASYGLEPDRVEAELHKSLSGRPFLYDDVEVMLDALDASGLPIAILTYGEQRFQEFKARLVPRLEPYKVLAILEEKADYLTKHPESCMLIDDRPASFGRLPKHCIGVFIDRQQHEKCVKTDEGFAINTLEVVGDLL